MGQQTSTFLLRGGLNLVSPPISIPPGQAIAAINYEPDVAGYSSVFGYERYDGHDRPSDSTDAATIAARRAAISAVPGSGPVRGVQVFNGHLYAFRDTSDASAGKMYRDSSAGWVEMTFGYEIAFTAGTAEFVEGEVLVGGTSTATATIERVVLRTGAWSGTATGYLVLSNVSGTFQAETGTTSAGSATLSGAQSAITLAAGGYYNFTTHNFYGAAKRPCLYGAYGQSYAFEWTTDGVLSPIRTGTAAGSVNAVDFILAANGDFILAANGDSIILLAETDRPEWIEQYKNHLFLGYNSGSLINSSIGEPLEYITTTGAGEISFGHGLSGLISSTSSIVIFARNTIGYLTGADSFDFNLQVITDSAGAVPHSVQMMDGPVYLDDGGIRNMSTTSAFGDWRMGALSQLIEPLLKQKSATGVMVVAALRVKSKDQYRLYFDDGSGVTVYIGRKDPEAMPFKLPIDVFCACSGEMIDGQGERLFVGCEDGYVYELDRGVSFDGAAIKTYVRLPFNAIGGPTQNKRFNKFTAELDSPDDIEIGLTFDVDYARGLGGAQVDTDVDAGTSIITSEEYASIDWTQVVQGTLEVHIDGIGKNIAVTLITNSAVNRPHTLSSGSFNFAPRGMIR